MSEAKGKYIARMNVDDIMLPDRQEVQFTCMELHRRNYGQETMWENSQNEAVKMVKLFFNGYLIN